MNAAERLIDRHASQGIEFVLHPAGIPVDKPRPARKLNFFSTILLVSSSALRILWDATACKSPQEDRPRRWRSSKRPPTTLLTRRTEATG